MATQATSRPTVSGPALQLSSIRKTGQKLPSRLALYAIEKFGKTSLAAQAPSPVFLMTQGENGLESLIDAGRLPETPHFPELQTWQEFKAGIKVLATEEHSFKTAIVDTVNGLERMCHRYVCERDYGGAMDRFLDYGKGPEVSLPEWTLMLNDLDRLRETRRMMIIFLAHAKVKGFKNPQGADYDRYMPDMHEKTWGVTHKWADIILFGNFDNVVLGGNVATDDRKNRKGKAASVAADRVLYAERRTAFDAGNRIGLPAEIPISSEGAPAAWADLMAAVKEARAATAPVQEEK